MATPPGRHEVLHGSPVPLEYQDDPPEDQHLHRQRAVVEAEQLWRGQRRAMVALEACWRGEHCRGGWHQQLRLRRLVRQRQQEDSHGSHVSGQAVDRASGPGAFLVVVTRSKAPLCARTLNRLPSIELRLRSPS
eukprot:CAMPEP_0115514524 /NCGR_PEP_ID=MMETSP0271-20121206/75699_1 /TAXON_ID=71861 /ORGANISM="Scrippsiella trochoidea, Strain CCMP3099" /LENGTH=133 /DNA_ID=CAMNT_0002944975 /DNA_START=41 /DNA_END=442 /DNA_ORIENTATION=-